LALRKAVTLAAVRLLRNGALPIEFNEARRVYIILVPNRFSERETLATLGFAIS